MKILVSIFFSFVLFLIWLIRKKIRDAKIVCNVVKDLRGKIIVFTGPSSGLGYETVKHLAGMNGTIILACRSEKTGKETAARLKADVGRQDLSLVPMVLDLADLESIQRFANEFQSQYKKVDILVNNAAEGIGSSTKTQTKDGFETIVGTNHFGTFTLTCLLLPLVVAAKGRIVTVSSSLHKRAQFSLDDLMGEKTRFGIGRNQYAVSKLLNLYMAYELHYKYSNRGITSVALHPGFVSTNLSRGASSFARKGDVIASFIFGKTVFQGAQTILYACLSDDVKSGGYYGDCKEEKSNPTSYNIEMASSVWEMSVIEITKRLPGFHRPV